MRFIVHNFPLSALGLKAAAIAECMPPDEYFPYIKTVFTALLTGVSDLADFENKLYQYASLGGLPVEKAKECANDPKFQNPIVADRADAIKKYNIEATPTFVINEGQKIVNGDMGVDALSNIFNHILDPKTAPKGELKKK